MQVVKLPESANPALGLRFALQIGDKCDKTLTIRETGRDREVEMPAFSGSRRLYHETLRQLQDTGLRPASDLNFAIINS
jgi:hypothetical protein